MSEATEAASKMRRRLQIAQAYFAQDMYTADPVEYAAIVEHLDAMAKRLETLELAEAADIEGYLQAAWEKYVDDLSERQVRQMLKHRGLPYGFSPSDEHPGGCGCIDCRASWQRRYDEEWEREQERESQRKQRANWNAVADGREPPYPDEY